MKECLDFLLIGAGPAGTGPLVNACKAGRGDDLARRRIGIVDQSESFAVGGLDRYAIRSNSYATSFIECVEGDGAPAWLQELRDSCSYRWLSRNRSRVVPLPIVARFQRQLGAALQRQLCSRPGVWMGLGRRVTRLTSVTEGWTADITGPEGAQQVTSRKVLIATGGRQRPLPAAWPVATPAAKLFGQACSLRLRERRLRHVLILGGSHSAWAAAWKLLRHGGAQLRVTMLCRRRPKAFYDSEQAALAAGYEDFDPATDICPLTHRVFRLGGLRGDARRLFLDGHPRLEVVCEADFLLDAPPSVVRDADLVVNALGYEPACPSILESSQQAVVLRSPRAVDQDCRLLRDDGSPLEGLYGIGLGMGYRLPADMGGEPGFTGQTNGLWLYQNDVGERVMRQVLGRP